jgi:hypothetical protein
MCPTRKIISITLWIVNSQIDSSEHFLRYYKVGIESKQFGDDLSVMQVIIDKESCMFKSKLEEALAIVDWHMWQDKERDLKPSDMTIEMAECIVQSESPKPDPGVAVFPYTLVKS